MAPLSVGLPEACWSSAQHHLLQQREEKGVETSERGNRKGKEHMAGRGIGWPSEKSTFKTFISSSQSMERERLVSNCLLHAANFMVISKRLGTLRTKKLSAGF